MTRTKLKMGVIMVTMGFEVDDGSLGNAMGARKTQVSARLDAALQRWLKDHAHI